MLTTAEHEYTRFGYQLLLQSRAVDIVQPDISWLGGITEARRIIAMASTIKYITSKGVLMCRMIRIGFLVGMLHILRKLNKIIPKS